MNRLTWAQLKIILDSTSCPFVHVDGGDDITVHTNTPAFSFFCEMVAGTDDYIDFTTNYEGTTKGNSKTYDESGRTLSRLAIANSGNGIHCHAFTFSTCDLDSFRSKEDDNTTDHLGFTYTLYNSSGVEITNPSLENTAVQTEIIWMPPYDYEMIGGTLHQQEKPDSDIYGFLTACPDIPVYTKNMCTGGLNLKFMESSEQFKLDGRAPHL